MHQARVDVHSVPLRLRRATLVPRGLDVVEVAPREGGRAARVADGHVDEHVLEGRAALNHKLLHLRETEIDS